MPKKNEKIFSDKGCENNNVKGVGICATERDGKIILPDGFNTGRVSDGYHTFDELYDHRITLFIAMCRILSSFQYILSKDSDGNGWDNHLMRQNVWRSKKHSDESVWDGWFIMGINNEKGKQITYHLPLDRWEETDFAPTLEKAPGFDGHSPEDVLKRLKEL